MSNNYQDLQNSHPCFAGIKIMQGEFIRWSVPDVILPVGFVTGSSMMWKSVPVYLDNEDMQVIVDAAKNKEAATTKSSSEVGKNFDFKI